MPNGSRHFPTRELEQLLPKSTVAALRQTQANADTKGLGKSVTVRSNAAGVFDPSTVDLIVQFFDNDLEIANRTIRGVLNTGTGEYTLTSPAFNTGLTDGDETEVNYYGTTSSNVGDSVRADVTHVKSRKMASAAFSAIDNSVAGSTPGTIVSGGGGGDFPPGGGGGGSK